MTRAYYYLLASGYMVHILLGWDGHFTDLFKVHKRAKAEEVEVPGLEAGRTETLYLSLAGSWNLRIPFIPFVITGVDQSYINMRVFT